MTDFTLAAAMPTPSGVWFSCRVSCLRSCPSWDGPNPMAHRWRWGIEVAILAQYGTLWWAALPPEHPARVACIPVFLPFAQSCFLVFIVLVLDKYLHRNLVSVATSRQTNVRQAPRCKDVNKTAVSQWNEQISTSSGEAHNWGAWSTHLGF